MVGQDDQSKQTFKRGNIMQTQKTFQQFKVNDFIITNYEGDYGYEKKSGSYKISTLLGLDKLKYCLKHSIAHRKVLNAKIDSTNEYKFYRNVKILIEKLIDALEYRQMEGFVSFHGIKAVVDYGNSYIMATDYNELPQLPQVRYIYNISEYGAIQNLIGDIISYKHKKFTEEYRRKQALLTLVDIELNHL